MTDAQQYELNEGDNIIWGYDKSGSMQTNDVETAGGKISRDAYAKQAVVGFVREGGKYDTDGATVIAFGEDVVVIDKISAEEAANRIGAIKAVDGFTRTDLVIKKAYELHKAGGYKQSVLFLITDGEPTGVSQEEVKNVIRGIAKEVSETGDEFGFAISFLTVGKRSEGLKAFLTDLDDNLNAAIDIVDVKELSEIKSLGQAFAGALHD